ncbi:MAG: hypothetical protein NTZ34_02955 [Chloroflexi bacterium]|nr:hypothetical protein [Chloroflexota bacterium]
MKDIDLMGKLRENRLIILMAFILLSVIITSYSLYENKYPPITTADISASTYTGQNIRISDLTKEGDSINTKVFVNCDIYGPALVHFNNCTLNMLNVDEDWSSILVVTPNSRATGTIYMNDCVLTNCRFHRIGLIGDQQFIDNLKKSTISK